MLKRVRTVALTVMLALATVIVSGCGAKDEAHDVGAYKVVMAEVSTMPSQVQSAPQPVRDAYRFAATHAELLQQIPCYCGCNPLGHLSNYACFWQRNGQIDEHALNCGICIYIAQDVNEMLARGRPLVEIRAEIDADYSRFGPPTDTAPVVVPGE